MVALVVGLLAGLLWQRLTHLARLHLRFLSQALRRLRQRRLRQKPY